MMARIKVCRSIFAVLRFWGTSGAVVLVASTLLIASLSPANADETAAERGKQISRQHCARCHVIPGLRNMGIGSTPSFKTMVKSKSREWRDKFEAFFSLRPHPAFVTIQELRTERKGPAIAAPIVMSLRDLDDLMAYVDALAEEFRSK